MIDINWGNIWGYFSFSLNGEQIGGTQYFQGIVFYRNDIIYCLSGDNKYENPKLLYKYSALNGELLAKYEITAGKQEALNDDTGGVIHYEPEGLAYKDGYLYFVIITGERGNRIKRLYRIKRF